MPAKQQGKCSIFLKKTDMYSEPIGPTFNGLKSYPTIIGGVLTITTTLLLLGWIAMQVSYVVVEKHGSIIISK